MPSTPRIKICCISSEEEAQMAIRHGASALGLVGEMPSGPGVIGDPLIAKIAAKAPPPIATFLLTSRTDAKRIIDHQRSVRTNTVQMVDALESGTYREIREALPGINLVQVIHVLGEESLDEALSLAPEVDAILLDSGNPNKAIKELGGTGKTHNWVISRKIVEQVSVPIFLAGGLNPGNARKAIEEVGPFGLDLCSGVRTDGKLDEFKLAAFMETVY